MPAHDEPTDNQVLHAFAVRAGRAIREYLARQTPLRALIRDLDRSDLVKACGFLFLVALVVGSFVF